VNNDAQGTTVTNVPDFTAVYTGLLLADREILLIVFLLANEVIYER
jgi:hypothetical protein